MRLTSFHSGGFTNIAVMNPPEKKLEKRTSSALEIDKFDIFKMPGSTKVD